MPIRPPISAFLASMLAATALGQDLPTSRIRLTERVPSPLVLLTSIAPGARPSAGAPRDLAARVLADDASARRLLAGLGLDGTSLDELSELVEMSTGEFELALLAPAPVTGALPALVGRFRLDAERATTIEATLRLGTLTEPSRQVGTQQIHVMRSRPDAASSQRGGSARHRAGKAEPDAEHDADATRTDTSGFELTLVGHDLLVSNDRSSLQSLLLPEEGSALARTSVAADPGFQSLLQRLTLDPGSVAIVLAWDRLVAELLARGDDASRLMLRALRLDDATHVALAARVRESELWTTVLIGFEQQMHVGAAGLFRLVREDTLRSLLAALPVAGSGGLALAVDLVHSGALGADSSDGRTSEIQPIANPFEVLGSCASAFGFHLDLGVGKQSVEQFAGLVTMQCVASPKSGAAVAIGLRTKQRGAAMSLFQLYAAGMVPAGERALPSRAELIELASGGHALRFRTGRGHPHEATLGALAAFDADLVFAADADSLDTIARANESLGRRAAARRQTIRRALGRLPVERAIGVFCAACADDPDQFHAGALRIDDQRVRIDMVSPM